MTAPGGITKDLLQLGVRPRKWNWLFAHRSATPLSVRFRLRVVTPLMGSRSDAHAMSERQLLDLRQPPPPGNACNRGEFSVFFFFCFMYLHELCTRGGRLLRCSTLYRMRERLLWSTFGLRLHQHTKPQFANWASAGSPVRSFEDFDIVWSTVQVTVCVCVCVCVCRWHCAVGQWRAPCLRNRRRPRMVLACQGAAARRYTSTSIPAVCPCIFLYIPVYIPVHIPVYSEWWGGRGVCV